MEVAACMRDVFLHVLPMEAAAHMRDVFLHVLPMEVAARMRDVFLHVLPMEVAARMRALVLMQCFTCITDGSGRSVEGEGRVLTFMSGLNLNDLSTYSTNMYMADYTVYYLIMLEDYFRLNIVKFGLIKVMVPC